jgi:hypothetical protein
MNKIITNDTTSRFNLSLTLSDEDYAEAMNDAVDSFFVALPDKVRYIDAEHMQDKTNIDSWHDMLQTYGYRVLLDDENPDETVIAHLGLERQVAGAVVPQGISFNVSSISPDFDDDLIFVDYENEDEYMKAFEYRFNRIWDCFIIRGES